jgi:hypothetical protein
MASLCPDFSPNTSFPTEEEYPMMHSLVCATRDGVWGVHECLIFTSKN